ncbi:hypothetical protein SMD11_2860 [Streptomyces albireticuli]|uniref:Uncharacterized protein n=1 Tax=Streptomyces albireticuli TaxID=1940 RepID=A0A1Z2L2K6_9ACTN|nr:hypothetical protein SMD11_2860 [Streptomyces albireticuli]
MSETAAQAGIKNAFIRAKRELIAEGYVHEWRRQSARGRWATTQLVSNVPLSAEEALCLRDGVRPAVDVPAVGQPTPPSVGHHPHNTQENTENPPSQPSPEPAVTATDGVRHPLIERGGLVIASVSHRDRRLRLTGRDVQQLAALAGEWLLRGATVKDLREALTDGLPDRVHSPVALIRNRLIRKMPDVASFAAQATAPPPAPQPLRNCAGGCARVFRPVADETRCRDCRREAAEAREAAGSLRRAWLQLPEAGPPVLSASGALPGSGPGSGPA